MEAERNEFFTLFSLFCDSSKMNPKIHAKLPKSDQSRSAQRWSQFFSLSLRVADCRHARPKTVKRPYDTVIHFDQYGCSTHSAYVCLRCRVTLAWVWVQISEAHAAEINKQAPIDGYGRRRVLEVKKQLRCVFFSNFASFYSVELCFETMKVWVEKVSRDILCHLFFVLLLFGSCRLCDGDFSLSRLCDGKTMREGFV